MICPVCKKAMMVVEQHRIELDYCPGCRGVWFDGGELELLLESEKLACAGFCRSELLGLPEAASSGHRRHLKKCPVCRQGMKEIAVGRPPVNIDACRRGDGLWFDGGEVPQFLKQLAGQKPSGAGSAERVIDFLGEVFQVTE